MLVQVSEVGPQVLEVRFVVEEFHSLQHEGKVDHYRDDQRCQGKQEEKQQYLGSELQWILPTGSSSRVPDRIFGVPERPMGSLPTVTEPILTRRTPQG